MCGEKVGRQNAIYKVTKNSPNASPAEMETANEDLIAEVLFLLDSNAPPSNGFLSSPLLIIVFVSGMFFVQNLRPH